MKFGLYAINYGTCADPDSLVRVAQYAEAGGLDSLWAGEHIVLPSPQPPDYPIAPEIPFLDAIVALALAAAHTTSITVATGILELPLHQPVMLAKQLASVDLIAGGRLMVGVGVGYLPAEFAALGVPLDERATRTDEYLEAMRALWTMETPEFHGRHVEFAGVDANPRPVQPGGPPIMIGGNSALARRRAITSARGWLPADFDLDATRAARDALDRDLNELERPASLGPFDFTVISPSNRLDRELVDGYRALGVDRLIVLPGLDVPTERRYHAVPIDDIFRSIDHLTELARE
ncbi:MAG TPA: TIGR03619 family F420-dependent LLM class oxidoreductase [Ilumatobacteraceae bacterium]|nr:TIGR03619 family F420-dependent LLM class oxidoreductase [Ilumatobacteraceae bacterium]